MHDGVLGLNCHGDCPLQIVFAHIWLLLMRSSTIAHDSIQSILPAPLFASVAETALRFATVAWKRPWREFLYVSLSRART